MLPNQEYLEAGRRARANFLNLAFYMETHDGRLPSDLRKVPSIEEQLNSEWREDSERGYRFSIDVIQRPRRIDGQLRLEATPRRSKRAQAAAGGADRRTTDDGGHFIAARFGGPRSRFNHFAQDASFNRGAYRALEDSWARDLKAGREVFVEIAPQYSGASTRPSSLVVVWYVGGKRHREEFSNEKGNKPSGRR